MPHTTNASEYGTSARCRGSREEVLQVHQVLGRRVVLLEDSGTEEEEVQDMRKPSASAIFQIAVSLIAMLVVRWRIWKRMSMIAGPEQKAEQRKRARDRGVPVRPRGMPA